MLHVRISELDIAIRRKLEDAIVAKVGMRYRDDPHEPLLSIVAESYDYELTAISFYRDLLLA